MKPIILFYNTDENKINKIKPTLSMMGVGCKTVSKDELQETVSYIAFPNEANRQVHDKVDTSLFTNEFMLFCNIDKKSLDKILNYMKRKKIGVSLKAMMTETNKNWSFAKLLLEITAERDAIRNLQNNK